MAIPAPAISRQSVPAWALPAAVALALALAYQLVSGARTTNLVYFLYGLVCATAVLVAARRHRGRVRLALASIGLGIAAAVGGDGVWAYDEVVRRVETPFPSLADALYLASYPLQLVGLAVLLRRRVRGRGDGTLLDAAIISCGATSLSWTFLIRSTALDGQLTLLQRAVTIAYPAMDLLLLVVAVKLLLTRRTWRTAETWFGLALLSGLGADVVYGLLNAVGRYEPGSWVDTVFLISYACWAVGAVEVPTGTAADAEPVAEGAALRYAASVGGLIGAGPELAPPPPLGWVRVAFLGASALLAPACMLLWIQQRTASDIGVVAGVSALAFALVMARLIGALRQLAAANELIEQSRQDRQRLLRQAVEAAEIERIRVAGELHDGPVQALAAMGFDLQVGLLSLAEGDAEDVGAIIRRTAAEISHQVADIRQLMAALRPPILDDGGIVVAIEDHVRAVAERSGLAVRFEDGTEGLAPCGPPLAGEVETALYRVTQEALSNVVRHAGASTATVGLHRADGRVTLTVSDDGAGFDRPETGELLRGGHYGLAGIAERAQALQGSFELDSGPGRGTCLRFSVPCAPAGVRAQPVG